MTSTNAYEKQSPHVIVQFGDGAHTFLLPAGATLVELADRVDDLVAMHDCWPLAIHVDFDITTPRPSTDTRSHRARHRSTFN